MKKARLLPIYIANLFLSLHYATLLYINSSYLSLFVSQKMLGFLYVIAAVITILLFINISRILRSISVRKLFFTFAFLDLIATLGLGTFKGTYIVPFLFIIFDVCALGLLFCLDIFLESGSEDERTGRIRSSYLTVTNVAVLSAPLFAGFVIGPNDYWKAYIISSVFLILMIAISLITLTEKIHPSRHKGTMVENMKLFWKDAAVRKIFGANYLLQFFYSWMVVYTPIYLHRYLGFEWSTIGVLFTIMLAPFVLFEIPVGRIADKILGEKEFLIAGFIIIIIFTAFIPYIPQEQLLIWAFVLFMTRVGASFVEVTTESYFFKHVNSKQSGFIGLFRLAEPLAFVTGPLAAIVALTFIPFQYIFVVLGIFMLLGLRFAFALKDTK